MQITVKEANQKELNLSSVSDYTTFQKRQNCRDIKRLVVAGKVRKKIFRQFTEDFFGQ